MTAGAEPGIHPPATRAWLNRALTWLAAVVVAIVVCWSPDSEASGLFSTAAREAVDRVLSGGPSTSKTVAAAGRLEVAFSPDEGAEALVLKAVGSAQAEICVMAYTFNSAPVTKALLAAVHRGVKVRMVVDHKNNLTQDSSGKARAALGALHHAGAEVRTIRVYQIAHDKVMVIDGRHVEMGSFNYSASAERRNSENVLVNWDNPDLAAVYRRHFDRNYRLSEAFEPQY